MGHAGTLDPFATGLLLVLVGRATRAQRFLLGLPKTYRAVARLGWLSDTGDRDGRLEHTGKMPGELAIPVGGLMQRPPAYSAVKVGGEPLYRKARRGEPEEGEPRPVTVHRAELLWHESDRAAFEIECSAGTYVRQLIAALGDAYCEELERTAIGPFSLAEADPARVLPIADALTFLPERALDAAQAAGVAHGRRVPIGGMGAAEGRSGEGEGAVGAAENSGDRPYGPFRLTHDGELLAVAERRGSELQPVVVFAA